MPSKTWTSEADFNEGTHVGTEATVDGRLCLQSGVADGYWLSQIYEAIGWQHWSQFDLSAIRPTGTVVVYKFRSGVSAASLSDPDEGWSPWMDGFDSEGNLSESIFAWYANKLEEDPTFSHGPFWQVMIRLVKE